MPVPVHELSGTEQYLPILEGHPQVFTPGERFAYNNSGFVVLALIAQRVSGTRFEQLVVERVCTPAGLTKTGFLRSDQLQPDVAIGYLSPELLQTNVFHLPVMGSGDGGIFSTAADMRRFWTALFDGRIVSPESVALMTKPLSDVPEQHERYGLGFWLADSGAGGSPRGLRPRHLVPIGVRPHHARQPHGVVEHVVGCVADHEGARRRPRHGLNRHRGIVRVHRR